VSVCWTSTAGLGRCILDDGYSFLTGGFGETRLDLPGDAGCIELTVDASKIFQAYCFDPALTTRNSFGVVSDVVSTFSNFATVPVGPLVRQFSATPDVLSGPFSSTITWDVANADTCTLTRDGAPFAATTSGEQRVFLDASTSFHLACTKGDITVESDLPVSVGPTVENFFAFAYEGDIIAGWGITFVSSCSLVAIDATNSQTIGRFDGDPQDSVRLPAFAAFNQEHDVIVELTCRDSAGEELFNDTLTVTQE